MPRLPGMRRGVEGAVGTRLSGRAHRFFDDPVSNGMPGAQDRSGRARGSAL